LVAGALAGFAACSSTQSGDTIPGDDSGGGSDSGGTMESGADASDDARHDAGSSPDAKDALTEDSAVDAEAGLPCSEAGWCATALPPGPALTLDSVWPLADRAFAVGSRQAGLTSSPRQRKVLEYDGRSWSFFDDGTQLSADPYGEQAAIWASGPDDVWVAGSGGNFAGVSIEHATRAGGSWTWTSETVDALGGKVGVWGTGPNDIYVWSSGANAPVLHYTGPSADGGSPWGAEYQPPSGVSIGSMFGTGPDDVWVIGGSYGTCGFAAHRMGGAYTVVVQGASGQDPYGNDTCTPVAPYMVAGDLFRGFAIQPGQFVVLNNGQDPITADPFSNAMLFASDGDGGYRASVAPINGLLASQHGPTQPLAIWGPSTDDLYVSGYGTVLYDTQPWVDGGAFHVSTIAENGSPLIKYFYDVRGTAPNDIWVVGDSYALHKTSP
jgi:hypothetical protein